MHLQILHLKYERGYGSNFMCSYNFQSYFSTVYSQVILKKHGFGEWFFSDGIRSAGINKWSWSSVTLVPTLSSNIHNNSIGKFGFDHFNCTEFSPSHPHVLFPFKLVLHWSLLFLCNYTQNADELLSKEELYLLCRMYDPTFFLLFLCC